MKTLWEAFIKSGTAIEYLVTQPSVASILSNMDETEVLQLQNHLQVIKENVEAFSRHAARNEQASRYAIRWNRMYEVFLEAPSMDLLEKLEQHSRHVKVIHSGMRKGNWHESILDRLLQDSTSSLRFLGSTLQEEIETGDTHKTFVRDFEREFKVKATRYESVSNGVYVYLDAENTNKVQDALLTCADFFNRITDKFGYICIRRGQIHDIDYGSHSEKLSKWVFVHCPSTPEKDIKKLGKTKVYGKKELSSTKPKDFEE